MTKRSYVTNHTWKAWRTYVTGEERWLPKDREGKEQGIGRPPSRLVGKRKHQI